MTTADDASAVITDAQSTVSLLGWKERERYNCAQTHLVGVGSCSRAIHCQLDTETWVVKKFHTGASQAMLDQIAHEVAMLRISSALPASPNVVTIRDVFEASTVPALCISLEDCGESLDRVLAERGKGGPVRLAAPYFADLCTGVAHLHQRRIVHRDIKPANLALANRRRVLKIIDLGSACLLDDVESGAWQCCTCNGGTPLYMPLDALSGAPPKPSHDTWSVGVVGYLLFTGRLPFNAKNADELRRVVRVGMHGPARLFEGVALRQEVALSLTELLSPDSSPSEALSRAHASIEPPSPPSSPEPPSPPSKARKTCGSPVSVIESANLEPRRSSAEEIEGWSAMGAVGPFRQPPFRRTKRVMT